MSIVLRDRVLVTDVFAVPFHTKHRTAFQYVSRNSVLNVHQKVPNASLKRFPHPQKFPFKRSKPSQSKPDPVHEKPVQAPTTIKNVPPQNQEREFLDGSTTVGGGVEPSQTKPGDLVHEKPFQVPSRIKTVRPKKPKRALFAGSVTMLAAPSPRHVPVPMFCVR